MKFNNEYLLDYLYNFEINKHSLDEYNWLPSVRYRNIIAEATRDLLSLTGNTVIFPAIICHSHQQVCYICNDPKLSIAYSGTMLKTADPYFDLAAESSEDFFSPLLHYPKNNAVYTKTLDVYAKKFNFFDTLALIRHCEDLTIIIGLGHNKPIVNVHTLYEQHQQQIEEIAIYLFGYFKDLYIEQHPGLKYTRFMQDESYRKEVIKGYYDANKFDASIITPRECECLYWISKGKTSQEAAKLMNISVHTINEHKKSISKKMSTNNMSQSVYLAVKHQLIV